ncbi:MAG: hypothetical protein KAS19_11295, partial [Anaerolineales bacterium]|nr:hypothetical protein [Anaerolineales bacterium]
MIWSKKLSYRTYVLVSLAIVLMMLAAGCKAATPEPPVAEPPTDVPVVEEPPVAPEVSEHQAPMLAELVAAGTLPPLADRLPMADDIQVVVPLDTVGEYGGTWYTMAGASDIGNIKMKVYEPPWRWKPDYTGYESGLARS